jgi:NTP pyrophosphatase (non-canonical NTP hydrolase)
MKYETEVKKLLKDDTLTHLLAGLSSEVGEVCGLFQKAIYKKTMWVSEEQLKSELGDVLFYLTALAGKYGFSLKELQTSNIAKLNQRYN